MWDEAASTMKWQGDLGSGITSESAHHFIDQDHYEWTMTVKDRGGKVCLDVKGKHTRAR